MLARTPARAALLSAVCCSLGSTPAFAQCDPAWQPASALPGVDGEVDAITAWDPDGPGPLPARLVIGGLFTTAGGVPASNIAVWDGAAWAPLGVGANDYVLALAAHPSGDLYAAGTFTAAGGLPASRIARWDGAQWHALGAGCDSTVYALAILPSGELVAGGAFDAAGGATARFVARWSPAASAWSPLGAGFNDVVFALAARPSGELFAGGWFTLSAGAGVRSIARWTGSAWSSLGQGITDGGVFALAVGPGGDLYAGGDFLSAGGAPANHVARWSGTGGSGAWSALGPGIGDEFDDLVFSIAARPDGSIIAAGRLTDLFGTGLSHIGAWNGAAWSPLGSGIDGVVVYAAAEIPGGDLAAGGLFSHAGGIAVDSLARWGSAGSLTISTQPQSTTACPGGPAQFTVAAAGAATYRWRHDGMPIDLASNPTAHSPTLIISACIAADGGFYDCQVAGACGSVTSDPAALTFCAADLNCDGLVDFADYLEFLNLYDAQDPAADLNQDGLVDFSDYLEFLNLYDAGC